MATQVQLIYPEWERLDRDERFSVSMGELVLDPSDPRCGVIYCYTDESDAADKVVCERLFEQFNIGDYGGTYVRSMSVGDMVRFRDSFAGQTRTYVCAPIGFKRIDGNVN
jgi:hypothetical protein